MENKLNTKKRKENSKTFYIFLTFQVNKDKETEASEANAFLDQIQKELKIHYSKEFENDNKINFVKILKYELLKPKKDDSDIKFLIETNKYEYYMRVSYEPENFIYEIKLFRSSKEYKNMNEIYQNKISLSEKTEIFNDSLSKNKELLDKFNEDTIILYSFHPIFYF